MMLQKENYDFTTGAATKQSWVTQEEVNILERTFSAAGEGVKKSNCEFVIGMLCRHTVSKQILMENQS